MGGSSSSSSGVEGQTGQGTDHEPTSTFAQLITRSQPKSRPINNDPRCENCEAVEHWPLYNTFDQTSRLCSNPNPQHNPMSSPQPNC